MSVHSHQRRSRIERACKAARIRCYLVDLDRRTSITFVVERERADEIEWALREAGFSVVVAGRARHVVGDRRHRNERHVKKPRGCAVMG